MPIRIEQLADVFVDVADTLVADFDLIEFLQSVAQHATAICDGAAAGVMLRDQEMGLRHVGASSEDARLLELFQIQHSEGPCFDSYRSGERVIVTDLPSAEDRWPLFVPRALAAGMTAVHAFPLRLRDEVIGGLNVFQYVSRDLTDEDVRIVQALADMATIALLQERAVRHAELVTTQLQVALDSRIIIEQAKGAVARILGVTVDEAFEVLRSHARSTQRRLTDVARDAVTSRDGLDQLRRR